jgi:hypothetical protein
VALAAIAYGLYQGVRVAVSGIPAAILGGFATLAITHLLQRRREIEAAQRQRKIETYTAFLDIIFADVVVPIHQARERKKKPNIDSAAITGKILGLSANLGLWASDATLRSYCDFLDRLVRPGSSQVNRTMFDELGDIILIFRKDLGYRNGRLTARTVHPLFGVPRNVAILRTETQTAAPDASAETDSTPQPPSAPSATPEPMRGPQRQRPRRRPR